MIKILCLIAISIFAVCYILIVDKNPKILIYSQIIYIILALNLISLGITSNIKFLSDGINVLIFIYTLFAIKKQGKIYAPKVVIALGLFLIIAIVSAIINQANITQFFWALRNNCRAFVFFFGCIYLLDKNDVKNILKILDICLIISLFLCLYQYFVLNLNQDLIGGILGTESGANACMNMLMCIIITYKMIKFLNKEISTAEMISYIIITMVIATISELKVYYFEFIVIFAIGIILFKPSKRTMFLIGSAILTLVVAVSTLYVIYENFDNFFSVDAILEYSKEESYDGEDSINRMSAIEEINKKVFTKNIQRLFGIGTGEAEVSSLSIFNSEFGDKYNDTMEYIWFSQAIILIENGFVGLVAYIICFLSFIELKGIRSDNIKKFSFILSILSIIFIFYDVSLRTEFAMIWLFALSIMYIYNKENIKKKRTLKMRFNRYLYNIMNKGNI